MKKLLLIISLIASLACVNGQILRHPNYTAAPVATEEEPNGITDDFESYSEGTLAGQGNWIAGMQVMRVYNDAGNNVVQSDKIANNTVCLRSETFSNDQYAEIELVKWGKCYVVVRGNDPGNTTFNGYLYGYWGTSQRILYSVTDGVFTEIVATPSITGQDGDILRLEVEGTTLRCYINGELDGQLGPGAVPTGTGTFTDATWSSGAPGIKSFGNAYTEMMDNFKAGNL